MTIRPTKRDELVRKALSIFYRDGFHATGMDTLAAETGVSKTSMYKHFRTKEELILAVLRLRDEQFRNRIFRRMEELAETPGAQLLALFDALAEWFAEPGFQGCMFVKASAEYQKPDHPIHVQSAEHKRLFFQTVRDIAEEAGAQDPDGLYALARAGEIEGFTGVDAPYEAPENPELRLDTGALTIAETLSVLTEYVDHRFRLD